MLLRQRIVGVLRQRRIEPSALLATADGRRSSPLAPVLAALLVLPRELQYRFVARDLVIVDVEANLVVDVLPNAFPLRIDSD